MANYLWKAKDGRGKTVALRRPAASVKEAQTQLLQEGFTDLELQTDDIGEAASNLFEEKVEVTPEETQQFLIAHREDELLALCEPLTAVPVR